MSEATAAEVVFGELLKDEGWSVEQTSYEPETGKLSLFIRHDKSQVEKELRIGYDALMVGSANLELFLDEMNAFIQQATRRLGGRVWVHGETAP
jgi:Neuraminidase (sialidase)